jgi:hypothetical protein
MGKVHGPDDRGVQRQMRECKPQQEGGTTLLCCAQFIQLGLLPEGPVRLTARPSPLGCLACHHDPNDGTSVGALKR